MAHGCPVIAYGVGGAAETVVSGETGVLFEPQTVDALARAADDIRACGEAGCRLDFTGSAFSLDGAYNLSGNPHSDDYYDLGLSVVYLPVISAIHGNASASFRFIQCGNPGYTRTMLS
jgi:hypothetical protein